jgi:hypothetical protein
MLRYSCILQLLKFIFMWSNRGSFFEIGLDDPWHSRHVVVLDSFFVFK